MQNNSIELISGAYTNVLWETLEDVLTNEDSPAHIYNVLKTLHDCGKEREAFIMNATDEDIAAIVKEIREDD